MRILIIEDEPRLLRTLAKALREEGYGAHGQSGLGLAICRAIVDAHGGTIEVSSRPAGGTVFTVKLPVFPAGHTNRAPAVSVR